MEKDREFVKLYPETEQRLHQLRRKAIFLYKIPQIHKEKDYLVPIAEDPLAHRIVCKVAIPLATNITFAILRPTVGHRFDLK